jgi:cytochrome c6
MPFIKVHRHPKQRKRKITSPFKILKIREVTLALLAFFVLSFGSGRAQAGDTINGGKLYAVHCVSCHGATGVNVMPDAPNFAQGEGLLKPDFVLLSSIKNGINAMPAYQGILSDQDILDVIVYLRTLY